MIIGAMTQISTLFPLLLSITLVSGHLQSSDRTTKRKGEPMKEGGKTLRKDQDRQQRSVSSLGNPDCLEGNPLGFSYTGNINVTTSGRTCQAWSEQEPHEHGHTELGEHNYCRNPIRTAIGVWCYTTIQISNGSTALSQSASQPMIVKKVIHLDSRM